MKRFTSAAGSAWNKKYLKQDFRRNYAIYVLFIPVLLYYLIFHYAPIYGLIVAFKDYMPSQGIFGSAWVGFENFQRFFGSVFFFRVVRNTVLISIYEIIFGFPAPIIFALLLNEIRSTVFKRCIQTVTYLPHFISTMVICGMILDFALINGLFNDIIAFFGAERTPLMMRPEMFRPIFIGSGIWQSVGWGSIIYLAALSSIDPELYDASYVDGAKRFQQVLHITLPCLLPTITILFILRFGGIMTVGFERVFLLYNPTTYEVADVISTFNYRKGLVEFDFGYSTAVGLFNSVINIFLLTTANSIARRVNETSLW